jgi:gluconolactonase
MLLGSIILPYTVSNLCFGGRNRSRLFVCASHTLYALYTNQRGAARP